MTQKYGKRNALSASGFEVDIDMGLHSIQFIQYYSLNPIAAFKIVSNNNWNWNDLNELFPKITFLHQHNLRNDLIGFLQCIGFEASELQFIKSLASVNVSLRHRETNLSQFYDDYLISYILKTDRLIFDFFPEFKKDANIS